MKQNILFGAYPWAFDCPGGGERQLMAWKSHLENLGHSVSLFNPWEEIPKSTIIFHFFSVMPGSIQLCDYIKSKGKKLIISPNLWVTPETQWDYPHEEIQRLVSIADLLIVNSLQEADALSDVYNLPKDRFHVVYNGLESTFKEPEKPEFFREHYGLGDQKFLLNVANVEPRKNQLHFLKALKKFPEIKLIVIGHVRDESYFLDCQKYGREQLIHIGALPYASKLLKSALAAAEGFVMPSTLETPSIAALEAAASGSKILITSVGSTKEYFGELATYINPNNTESMVHGIIELLRCDQKGLRNSIQNRFTWLHSTQQLIEAYKRVVN